MVNVSQSRTLDHGHEIYFLYKGGQPNVMCAIHLFTYGVTNFGAGWIGPHTTYPYYLLLLR
jgi:hypothetical protein